MKKLIFEYLNTSYPNAHIIKTKFGNLLCGYNEDDCGWLGIRRDMVKTIIKLFSCNFIIADDIIKEWCETRPMFESVKNSANEVILVSVKDELNKTVYKPRLPFEIS